MTRAVLAVGAPERARAGRAVFASIVLTVAFAGVTWVTKETPALDAAQPWQDDPFDVAVSLDFAVLPFLVVMIGWRSLLCRRYSVLPARRLVDLLRACRVALGVCLVTQAAEWVAFVLGFHRAQWDASTSVQVLVLTAFTVVTASAGVWLGAIRRACARATDPAAAPDWLADLVGLGLLVARRLRIRGAGAVGVLRFTARLTGRVRRHPVAAAASLSAALALPFVVAKLVLEGYPPLLLLLSFVLPASVLFAFLILAGWSLRLVAPAWPRVPPWLPALVAGCGAGPALFAFHDSIALAHTQLGLNALLFGGGILGATVVALAQLVARPFRFGRS